MNTVVKEVSKEAGSNKYNIVIFLVITVVVGLLAVARSAHSAEPIKLIGPNGEFMGNLNPNQFDPDSIYNPVGRYGDPTSYESIRNPVGKYRYMYYDYNYIGTEEVPEALEAPEAW